MENEIIMQLLRSGKQGAALQELYKAFPSVAHFIRTHGGREEDARDVFQESLLIFYRNVLKPDFTLSCNISTYLFSVCKYLWKDELKAKNKLAPFDANDWADDVESYREEEQAYSLLDRILNQLGDKCKTILTLFYYKKMRMEDIASQLEYSNMETAKTQKYKCMERAKTMMKSNQHTLTV